MRAAPTFTDLTDAELVVRAKDGDAWAKDALFRRYVVPLARLVTRLLARTEEADDVVQDAFAMVLRDLPSLRDPDAFRPWLYRIATNRARRVLARRRLSRALGLDHGTDDAALAELAAESTDPSTSAELRRIDAVLEKTPSSERIAWLLRHVEGYTLEEIASLVEASLATVKRRIRAADERIERHLGADR